MTGREESPEGDSNHGKCNRKIDHLLSTLLRIARDKIYHRAIKTKKAVMIMMALW